MMHGQTQIKYARVSVFLALFTKSDCNVMYVSINNIPEVQNCFGFTREGFKDVLWVRMSLPARAG